MKQILVDNFAKATPGNNDPTPANQLIYRLYVSQSPNMGTVTDVLTNGELIEEKVDADSFTWVTNNTDLWYVQIAVVSPVGGISVYEEIQSVYLPAFDDSFQLLVDTTLTGVSANNQFQLTGAEGTYSVAYDGNTEELTGEQTLTFATAGQNVIEINGGLTRIAFNNGGDAEKLLEVQKFGDIAWSTFAFAFYGCRNLVVTATDPPVMTNVVSCERMFSNNRAFQSSLAIENMDVSGVASFVRMFLFAGADNPGTFPMDLTGWTFRNDLGSTSFALNEFLSISDIDIESYNKFLISQANKVFANGDPYNVGMQNQNGVIYDSTVYAMGGEFNNAVDALTFLEGATANWDITGHVRGIEISDKTISSENLTTEDCDLVFQKATGDNALNFEYTVYTGDETALGDVTTIESQQQGASAIDVSTLNLPLPSDQVTYYNIRVRDTITGQIKIYDVGSETPLDEAEPPTEQPTITGISETSEGVLVDFSEINLGTFAPGETGYILTATLDGVDTEIDIGLTSPGLFPDPLEGETYEFTIKGYNPDGNSPESFALGYTTNVYGEVTATTAFTTA